MNYKKVLNDFVIAHNIKAKKEELSVTQFDVLATMGYIVFNQQGGVRLRRDWEISESLIGISDPVNESYGDMLYSVMEAGLLKLMEISMDLKELV